jgi:hypothetical protein
MGEDLVVFGNDVLTKAFGISSSRPFRTGEVFDCFHHDEVQGVVRSDQRVLILVNHLSSKYLVGLSPVIYPRDQYELDIFHSMEQQLAAKADNAVFCLRTRPVGIFTYMAASANRSDSLPSVWPRLSYCHVFSDDIDRTLQAAKVYSKLDSAAQVFQQMQRERVDAPARKLIDLIVKNTG